MDKLSYALGLGIGQQLKQMGLKDSLKVEDFAQSITDVLNDNELKISNAEAQTLVNSYFQEMEEKMQKENAEKGKKALEEGYMRVGLIVDFDNPKAEKLYASLGFKRMGEKTFLGHKMWHMQLEKQQ